MSDLYHTVIYMQDYQDEALSRLMEDHDSDAIAKYLSQWDYGECHDTPIPLGDHLDPNYEVTHHTIKHAGEYTLMVHYGLGDATLLIKA